MPVLDGDEPGRTLSSWLFGKARSMVAVGAVTAIGLSVLGDQVKTPSEM